MPTLSDFNDFLSVIRKDTGLSSLEPDETGLVSVRVEDAYNLNLQFVAATGKILCFVEVMELPADAPASVYRDLLAGGLFGRDTAGGHFAYELNSDTVVYQYYFDFDRASADPDEFVSTLEKIRQLCDIWAERLRRDLAGEEPEGDAPAETRPHQMILA